ncbi:MAG: gamma carbonic anhydrase family protein [Bacteroidia bacterium]|nr:gamma carbonic anhydrase family protein [Bacteroidia bacterium]
MALIKTYKQFTPQINPTVFLAENATIIGDVEIGAGSSIWYFTVLRGDVGAIRIGERTNIQDGAIVHCTTGLTPSIIGNDCVIGHQAIIHGATIEDEVLIGMGAIVLDQAVVPRHTIVAAGALIPQGTILESGYMYAGIPAKKIKPLSSQQIEMIRMGAVHYVENGKAHAESKVIHF